MSNVTLEEVVEEAKALPSDEQQQLDEMLNSLMHLQTFEQLFSWRYQTQINSDPIGRASVLASPVIPPILYADGPIPMKCYQERPPHHRTSSASSSVT